MAGRASVIPAPSKHMLKGKRLAISGRSAGFADGGRSQHIHNLDYAIIAIFGCGIRKS